MANAIFPCPFCARRMGVNRDLLGRHVRCPHCKQVIQAPLTEGGTAAPGSSKAAPKPPPPAPAPSPAPPPEAPVMNKDRETPTFAKPPREAADSILGDEEESEDEVFASRTQNRLAPPDLSAFVPRLPGGGQAPVVVSRARPDATDVVDRPGENAPAPVPQPAPPMWGPLGITASSRTAVEPFDPNTLNKPGVVDATNLAPHLPRPQFQAPPLDAKGTGGSLWPDPPSFVPAPAPTSPIAGAPAPTPMESLGPITDAPMPPPVPAPSPAAPANPWAAYDLTGTQMPSLPADAAPPAPLPAPVAPRIPPPPPTPAFVVAPSPQQAAPTTTFAPVNPSPAPAASLSGAVRQETQFAPARITPAKSGGGSSIALLLLALYAVAATGAAVYAFFFNTPTQENKSGVDLSSIPDMIGQYPPADRKKVSNLRVPLDGPLPETLKVRLGNSLRIGQLEVTPLAIEEKPIRGKQALNDGQARDITIGKDKNGFAKPGLVLKLRLRNLSEDQVFHPTDPAFNRRDPQSTKEPLPGTGLVIGTKKFWGSPTRWPFADADKENPVSAQYYEGQEIDDQPLGPGETRETTIVSRDPRLITALNEYSGPILWRVQLRRGLENVNGKDVSMTAIVGVEFSPKDIRQVN